MEFLLRGSKSQRQHVTTSGRARRVCGAAPRAARADTVAKITVKRN